MPARCNTRCSRRIRVPEPDRHVPNKLRDGLPRPQLHAPRKQKFACGSQPRRIAVRVTVLRQARCRHWNRFALRRQRLARPVDRATSWGLESAANIGELSRHAEPDRISKTSSRSGWRTAIAGRRFSPSSSPPWRCPPRCCSCCRRCWACSPRRRSAHRSLCGEPAAGLHLPGRRAATKSAIAARWWASGCIWKTCRPICPPPSSPWKTGASMSITASIRVGLARALLPDLRARHWVAGGSTISQQTAKIVYTGAGAHHVAQADRVDGRGGAGEIAQQEADSGTLSQPHLSGLGGLWRGWRGAGLFRRLGAQSHLAAGRDAGDPDPRALGVLAAPRSGRAPRQRASLVLDAMVDDRRHHARPRPPTPRPIPPW